MYKKPQTVPDFPFSAFSATPNYREARVSVSACPHQGRRCLCPASPAPSRSPAFRTQSSASVWSAAKTFSVSLICSKTIQREFDLQQKHSTWVRSAAKTFDVSLISSKNIHRELDLQQNIQREFDLQLKHSAWVWSAAKTFNVSFICSKNIQREFDLQQKHST